jgi:hypothetical protein
VELKAGSTVLAVSDDGDEDVPERLDLVVVEVSLRRVFDGGASFGHRSARRGRRRDICSPAVRGRPTRPDVLNKLAVAAKVRPIGPRQIRHLVASSLLDAGCGLHEVAEQLGHDAATLIRYYIRVSAARRLQATDRIAELMTLLDGQAKPFPNRPDCTTSLLPEAGTSADMHRPKPANFVSGGKRPRPRRRKTDPITRPPVVAVGGHGPAG